MRAAGSRVADTGTLRRGFHEASYALEATAMLDGRAPEVASWKDLGALQFLLAVQDDEALRLYTDSVLGPIESGEGEYGGELLRSLEAFVEHNGQWERAARQLFCHRHTLRYRIRRVEQLTGRDLSSARDRIEFWLALKARELVQSADSAELTVAVLGAGGTIAPAVIRDLAESDEVAALRLLDVDERRAAAAAREHGRGRAQARAADARAGLEAELSGCDVLVNCASYRVNLEAMRGVPCRRVPLHRPRAACTG